MKEELLKVIKISSSYTMAASGFPTQTKPYENMINFKASILEILSILTHIEQMRLKNRNKC